MKTVLITGANGMIGQVLMKRLADAYVLRGLDIRPADGITSVSIADYDSLLPVLDGVDVVVHLAAVVQLDSPWEDVLENNIVGTRNVLEAARTQGVGRVVFASSHHSTFEYERDEPYASVLAGGDKPDDLPLIRPDTPFRPSSLYGASKAVGEILGRVYADHYGLSVICIRIVGPHRDNRPHGPRWLSHDDIEQLVRRCIEARDIRYGVYYGVSDNRQAVWDISNAKRDLGYEPKDGIR